MDGLAFKDKPNLGMIKMHEYHNYQRDFLIYSLYNFFSARKIYRGHDAFLQLSFVE